MIDSRRFLPRSLPRLALPLLAAAVPAQASAWTRAKDAPNTPSCIHYDPVHRRAVGFEALAARTWSFDGTRWRQHTPDGLDVFSVLNSAYDPAHGYGLVFAQGTNPWSPCRTYVGQGAGWRLAAIGGYSTAPDAGAAFAFDPVRNQVISFGGETAGAAVAVDTMRAWTGSSWVQLTPAVRPAPRTGCGMVHDRARNRVVLFGGYLPWPATMFGDTWEWNGTTWTQRTPAASPSARVTQLGFDPATQEVVALGGYDMLSYQQDCWGWNGTTWAPRGQLPGYSIHGCYDDGTNLFVVAGYGQAGVWRANGASWTQVFTDSEPNELGTIAYDPTRSEVLLAGGASGADTWRWNGVWQLVSATGPGPRQYPAMAALGAEMVLCGGWHSLSGPIFDTWAWNGSAWTMRFPAHQPSARHGHAMATVGNEVLLFGGAGPQAMDDTWSYDGVDWTQLQPAHRPPAIYSHGLAHDPVRGRTVLFGGMNNVSQFLDTWEWDGVDWLQRLPVTIPQALGSALAWDPVRARVVLAQTSSVYAWDGIDWTEDPAANLADYPIAAAFDLGRQRLLAMDLNGAMNVYGPTPAEAGVAPQACGNQPDLRCFGQPSVGRAPAVHVEGAPGVLAILAYGFATTLVHHAPGCDQLITVDATFAGVTDARGELSVPFAIPAALGLRGLLIHSQAVVLDGGPVYGASLSGALSLRIGD